MKKVKILITLVLFISILLLTGCDKIEKNKVHYTDINTKVGNFNITLTVPANEEGNVKYNFTTEKPSKFKGIGNVYLETDKTTLSISSEVWTYHTSVYYKDKHETIEPSFDDYIIWMKDPKSTIKLSGVEDVEINGRKAIRYYSREGSENDYRYYGYIYNISTDDINPKMHIIMKVHNNKEASSKAKEFDKETLSIINSLRIE